MKHNSTPTQIQYLNHFARKLRLEEEKSFKNHNMHKILHRRTRSYMNEFSEVLIILLFYSSN